MIDPHQALLQIILPEHDIDCIGMLWVSKIDNIPYLGFVIDDGMLLV